MRIAQVAITVREYDEAIAFYVGVLGFTLVEDTDRSAEKPGKRWVRVRPPGAPAGAAEILLARAATPEQLASVGRLAGGRVGLFLETDDLGRDHAAWTARGVHFESPPRDEPYGRVAVFLDLYGNRMDLIQPRPAPPAA